MSDLVLTVYDGECCRRCPLLLGVEPGPCGLCGEIPVPIPGTTRTVIAPATTSREPVLVATITKEDTPS